MGVMGVMSYGKVIPCLLRIGENGDYRENREIREFREFRDVPIVPIVPSTTHYPHLRSKQGAALNSPQQYPLSPALPTLLTLFTATALRLVH